MCGFGVARFNAGALAWETVSTRTSNFALSTPGKKLGLFENWDFTGHFGKSKKGTTSKHEMMPLANLAATC